MLQFMISHCSLSCKWFVTIWVSASIDFFLSVCSNMIKECILSFEGFSATWKWTLEWAFIFMSILMSFNFWLVFEAFSTVWVRAYKGWTSWFALLLILIDWRGRNGLISDHNFMAGNLYLLFFAKIVVFWNERIL